MAELYAGRNVDPEAMYRRMKGLMDAEGLPYGRRTHTYNSRLAQELGKWADTQPGGEAIHDAVDADWAKSHAYGVTGVPTFVAARYGVVGAQPYETLEALLVRAGAAR